MALQFILGTPGSGKSRCLFQRIIEESMAHPEQNFLVIVPEQFSMQTQRELVRLHPRGGILNIDVLSLNRLAYRIFDETGADTRELLEESGKSIVLRRISLEKKKEMPYLGRHLRQPGSISEIKSVLSELMQYAVTPEDLLAGSASVSPELRVKLQDIASLLADYRAYCREHFMNAEEVPTYLARLIGRSAFLQNCTVAFDGFTGFTPVQLPVLRELLIHARNVYITAAIDRTWAKNPGGDSDLYLMSRAMMRSLYDLAGEVKIPVIPPSFIEDGPESRLARSPELRFLEKHIFRNRRALYEGETEGIRITSCENPHAEVRSAARRIRRMVREKGFRYRDIAVIAGDLASYGDLIRRIFPEYDIPFFVDEKRSALHHPYIEFLRAAMQIITEGWSAGAVFRLLRTGLTDLAEDDIDRLENYVLALGIRSRAKWSGSFTLHYKGQDEKELLLLNALREQVLALLAPVHDAFTAPGSTASDKTKALYLLSTACDVQVKLAAEEEKLREDGQLSLAGEYAQIYAIVMRLFDKMADILGEHAISARDYRALFESALTETRIGITPPTGDQVTIGDVERSRLGEIKALLFIGVNDGVVPRPAGTNGILTEADRAVLESLGI
ncbi:MAG: helicase-exonuclease AddAB subunit AddB, partial [Lachnospiraceae bacterium]|nr:helicase-exonuclease AddAB subunit AddB [Lachnospiraceae bacterium]